MGTHAAPEWPERKNVVPQPQQAPPKEPVPSPPRKYTTPKKVKK